MTSQIVGVLHIFAISSQPALLFFPIPLLASDATHNGEIDISGHPSDVILIYTRVVFLL